MKIRLTESQYDKLLKLVNQNKKLIITESQYNRLILEGNSQDVFSEIKPGQAFKIKANGKEFKFEVIDSKAGQLLVKKLDSNDDVTFFIDYNGLLNNNLVIYVKEGGGPYNKIDGNLDKERLKSWLKYTVKNVDSFEVFETKLFNKSLFSINTEDGQKIKGPEEIDGPMDVNLERELRDNLVKGIVSNNSYEITFYDKSILKFFVTDKKGSIIDIKFKTKSGKDKMSDSDAYDAETQGRSLWFDEQNKLIDSLKLELTRTTDPKKIKTLQDKLTNANNLMDDYYSKGGRYEGFETISVSDYTDGIASKWVEGIEESAEYEFGELLKIDLSRIKVHEGKAKVISPEEDKKISDLNQKLSNATDDNEKEKIKNELNSVNRELTLHFLNPEFDVVNNTKNIVTFDLSVQLNYVPKETSKQTRNSKTYVKNFPLYGIESLSVINADKGPSLTDKREVKKGDRLDLNDISIEYSKIKNYIKNDINAQNMILKRPNVLMTLLGFKEKGIIPLEKLQSDLGFYTSRKDANDKFIAGHYILFNCDFNEGEQVFNDRQFEMFKKLLNNGIQTRALVKRYTIGDEHVALNMKDAENDILYTISILDKKESEESGVASKGVLNEYDVLLKFSKGKSKKEKVANFKIKVLDYNAAKTN
jgi:hypothetical protein